MWLYAAPFYLARIAEMRPALIVLAAIVAIGILAWKVLDCWSCHWRYCPNPHERSAPLD